MNRVNPLSFFWGGGLEYTCMCCVMSACPTDCSDGLHPLTPRVHAVTRRVNFTSELF